MAGNRNRGGAGLVYHWRHGWIPRTPTAALQKAKGSRKGADKLMSKHGIEGDLPGGSGKKADAPSPAAKSAASAAPARTPAAEPHKLKQGERATVRGTDEYGQPTTFTGIVRANSEVSEFGKRRTTGGKPLRAISIEREDNSRRQNVVYVADPDRGEQKRGDAASKPATDAGRAKVRDLPAGDSFKGVHSETYKGERLTVRKGKQWGEFETQVNGQTVSTPRGTRNGDAVKQLDSLKATIDHAKANPDNYRNGLGEASFGMNLDRPKADAPKAPAATKRVEIEHSGDGTTLTIDRGDTEAREAAKAAGFRWSRNLGAWYLPRTQHESTRRAKIAQLQKKLGDDAVNVDDGGRGATTTAAEREAASKAAAVARAERMDSRAAKLSAESERRRAAADAITEHIPMGQPILVGHHSQRRHERALDRANSNTHKSWEAAAESKRAEAAAERARKTAEGADPLARQRRVDRNEAEFRKVDKMLTEDDALRKMSLESQAKLNRIARVKPLSSDYRAQLEASRDRLRDDIAHDKAQIKASGIKQVTAKDVTSGDMVTYRGRTYIVTKVNKTTVSVPSGYSWDDKIPLNQVQRHIPLSTQSDSALSTAYERATDAKVKAALRAEMKRRGLSAA